MLQLDTMVGPWQELLCQQADLQDERKNKYKTRQEEKTGKATE